MESFIEYMWYLLISPFKKVKKSINHWYTLCKVVGKRFDEAKESILVARDEGMIATCSHDMLPVHGADRRLSRYTGEDYENFRSRIAMHGEVCALGGLNEGIILAVKSLGYNNPMIKSAVELKGDRDRWAEFYLIIVMSVDEKHPIAISILRNVVREWKEVGARDNYLFKYNSSFRNLSKIKERIVINQKCSNLILKNEILTFRYLVKQENKADLYMHVKRNLWNLDGTVLLNGTQILNSINRREKL